MSDSVKAWYEMQEEKANGKLVAPIKHPVKAYRILIDYNIEDIREAVKLYEENKLDEQLNQNLGGCIP